MNLKDILIFLEETAKNNETLAYFLLAVSAFAENIFPPAPGDTVTVFGAFLVGRGALDFTGVLISTTLGSIIGFMSLFYLGYYYGRPFLEKKNWKIFPIEMIDKSQKWFEKYGYLIIVINRFLAAIRAVISISAGIAKMKPLYVFLFAFFSTLFWNILLLYLGYIAGERWEEMLNYIQAYSKWFMIIIVTVVVLYFINKWRKKWA